MALWATSLAICQHKQSVMHCFQSSGSVVNCFYCQNHQERYEKDEQNLSIAFNPVNMIHHIDSFIHREQYELKDMTESCYCTLPALCHTITDDHAGLQRFIGEGLVADAAGPLVDIEEAAHAVARTVKVVQPRIPQSCTGKRIQQVT